MTIYLTPIAEYPSQCSHTAVHEQQGAGDVGGIVGGQKQDRGGDLVCPARTAAGLTMCPMEDALGQYVRARMR